MNPILKVKDRAGIKHEFFPFKIEENVGIVKDKTRYTFKIIPDGEPIKLELIDIVDVKTKKVIACQWLKDFQFISKDSSYEISYEVSNGL